MRVLLIPARVPSMTATAMLHTRPLGLAARPASRLQFSRHASSLHVRAASNDDGGSSDKAGRVTGGDGGKGFKRPDDATPLRVSLTKENCQVQENVTAMHAVHMHDLHASALPAVMHPPAERASCMPRQRLGAATGLHACPYADDLLSIVRSWRRSSGWVRRPGRASRQLTEAQMSRHSCASESN